MLHIEICSLNINMKDLPSLNINIRPLHQYIQAVEFCNIWATIDTFLIFFFSNVPKLGVL